MAESRNLNLILRLKDQASQELKGITDKIDQMQPAFRTMAAVGTAAFAGVGIGVGKAIKDAGKAEKIADNFEITFGESAGAINSFIEDFGTKFAFVESEMKEGANSIGFQLNAMGDIGKEEGEKITESLLTAAGGLSDFFGGQMDVAQASNALAKGLAGNRAQLLDMGFNVYTEDIKRMAEAMGMNTDELTKAQEAQIFTKLIMEQTTGSVKGLTENIDSYTARQRAMEKAAKEASETLGSTFLPIVTDLFEAITPLIEKLSNWIEKNPELARNILIVTAAVGGLVAILGIFGIMLPGLIAAVSAFGVMFTVLTGPIGLVVAAIAVLIAIGVLLWKNWDMIKEKTEEIWESIAEFLSSTGESIKKNIEEVWGSITDYFGSVWEDIKSGGKDAINFLIGLAESMANAYIKAANFIISALNKIQVSVPEWVPGMGGKSFGVNIKKVSEVSIPRLAEGGIVNKPTMAMVGESGPEAIIPLNRMAGAGAGGITINVYGDVTGQDLIDRVGEELMKMVRRETKL